MISRREFLQVASATAALMGAGGSFARVAAQQSVRQEDLLRFQAKGQLTLLQLVSIFLTPGLLAVAGVWMWVSRRRRL